MFRRLFHDESLLWSNVTGRLEALVPAPAEHLYEAHILTLDGRRVALLCAAVDAAIGDEVTWLSRKSISPQEDVGELAVLLPRARRKELRDQVEAVLLLQRPLLAQRLAGVFGAASMDESMVRTHLTSEPTGECDVSELRCQVTLDDLTIVDISIAVATRAIAHPHDEVADCEVLCGCSRHRGYLPHMPGYAGANGSQRSKLLEAGALPLSLEGETVHFDVDANAFSPQGVRQALGAFDFAGALDILRFDKLALETLMWPRSPGERTGMTSGSPQSSALH